MRGEECYAGEVKDGSKTSMVTVCIGEDGVRLMEGRREGARSLDALVSAVWRVLPRLHRHGAVTVMSENQAIVVIDGESFYVTRAKTLYNIVELAELLQLLYSRGYLR